MNDDDCANSANEARVARCCRDATYHAIKGLNNINEQSLRSWSEFDASDCLYQLQAAIGYLQYIAEIINDSANTPREPNQ